MTTDYPTDLSAPFSPEGARQLGGRPLNIKRLIRLRGWLMGVTAAVLALPLMIAAWLVVPAEYEASNFVAIQATRPRVLDDSRLSSNIDYNRYVSTQVALIQGPTILSRVVNDPQVRDLPWLQDQSDPLHFLMSKVEARVQTGSELIRISCRSTDRDAAVTVVSKTVETFVRYVTGIESEGIGQRRRLLAEERDAIQKRMEEQRARIAELKRNAGVTVAGSTPLGEIGLEYYHDKLGQAQAELTTAETDVARLEALVSEIERVQARQTARPSDPVHELGVEEKVASDGAVQALRQQEVASAQRIADMETKYVGDAPLLKQEQEALASIRKQLEQTKAQLRADALKTIYEQYRFELTAARKKVEDAQARADQFRETIRGHEKRLEDLSEAIATIEEEEAKLEQMRREYDQFVESIRVLDVEERAPGRVNEPSATIAPDRPQYGKRLQFMLMALVMSVGAAVCLGVFREVTDDQIRMPEDLRSVTDLPVLAAIPHSAFDRLPQGAHPALLAAEYPGSTTADQYRRIITRVVYPPEGSAELNTVLATSPSQGDGKTVLACNLAVSLAQAERRVLLVDICTRRPCVESCFGMEPGEGLMEVIAGKRQPNDVVRETRFTNLFVIGPGLESADATGKLASRDLVEFIEEAERAFDHVIIDSPPSLFVSDARLLAPVVDGVILVIGSGVSSLGMARRCVTELRQVGANLVGIVLNRIRPMRWGYLRDNVGKYYAYVGVNPEGVSANGRARAGGGRSNSSAEDELAGIVLLEDGDGGQGIERREETDADSVESGDG